MHVGLLRRRLIVTGWLCLLIAGWGGAAAVAEPKPGSNLVHKPLYLRGLWAEDELNFDSEGRPLGKTNAGSVTLSGIDVTSAKIHGGLLELTGYRVALVAKKDPTKGLDRKVIKSVDRDSQSSGEPLDKMKITIQSDAAGDFDEAIKRVFADGLPEFAGSVPESWRCYAQSYFVPKVAEDAFNAVQRCAGLPSGTAETSTKTGSGVQLPKVSYQVAPQFTVAAREMRVSGKTLVNLTVGKDGKLSDLKIVRAVGAGVDEEALAAVGQYKFQPATQNGVAVAVTLNIEVNFQIF
jgi:TonB family protein